MSDTFALLTIVPYLLLTGPRNNSIIKVNPKINPEYNFYGTSTKPRIQFLWYNQFLLSHRNHVIGTYTHFFEILFSPFPLKHFSPVFVRFPPKVSTAVKDRQHIPAMSQLQSLTVTWYFFCYLISDLTFLMVLIS